MPLPTCRDDKWLESEALTKFYGLLLTVASFLLDQHRRMPDYLRFPFTCLTLMFDVWPLPRTGHPFHRLSHEQRLQQIRAWRNSALGVRRDFIKFYETFAIFASYSEYYVNEEPH